MNVYIEVQREADGHVSKSARAFSSIENFIRHRAGFSRQNLFW